MAARNASDAGERICEFLSETPAYVDVIGRGPGFGAALCGGLLMREMIPIRGGWMASGTYRHGPLLDAGEGHCLFCLADGRTAELGYRIASDAAARGSMVVLITDQPDPQLPERALVVSVPNLGEECFPFLALQTIEQFIIATIEKHGTRYRLLTTTTE